MRIASLLIANRDEIAIRAAAELGMRSVAVFSEDDAAALHVRRTDAAQPLRGVGAAAYLDQDQCKPNSGLRRAAHSAPGAYVSLTCHHRSASRSSCASTWKRCRRMAPSCRPAGP